MGDEEVRVVSLRQLFREIQMKKKKNRSIAKGSGKEAQKFYFEKEH